MRIPIRQYWSLLADYFQAYRRKIILLTILLFTGAGIQLVNPQIIRYFIDTALSGETDNSQLLLGAAVLFMIAAILQQFFIVAATYVGEDVGWRSTNALRRDLAHHCLHLDMAFHHEHTPGEFIERVDGDVSTLANFFSQFAIKIVGNFILLVGIIVLLFREDWRVGTAIGLFALLMFLVLIRVGNIAVPHWKASRQASADFYSFLEERLAGTEDIRSSGATTYTLYRFHQLIQILFSREIRAMFMSMLSVSVSSISIALGTATSLLISAYLYQDGTFTIGSVYLVFHYTNLIATPIRHISEQVEDLQKAGAGITRVQEFLTVSKQIKDGQHTLPTEALSLTFDNVSFAYGNIPADKGQTVINNLSFHLQPGAVLGLLGRTGSGKTTLTRLIMRLYDPQVGEVRLGDKDIRHLQLADLRRKVGIVTQNVQLFRATVRDNLTFFDPSIPDTQILDTLKELNLWHWYEALADGLNTPLESGGSSLSTGEAQLLALARVFLKNPGLIILDEASSRLDPATEQQIQTAINRLLLGRTTIIIAHRLATVQRADNILILDQGKISEYGSREQLLRDETSQFYQLLQTGLQEVLS